MAGGPFAPWNSTKVFSLGLVISQVGLGDPDISRSLPGNLPISGNASPNELSFTGVKTGVGSGQIVFSRPMIQYPSEYDKAWGLIFPVGPPFFFGTVQFSADDTLDFSVYDASGAPTDDYEIGVLLFIPGDFCGV